MPLDLTDDKSTLVQVMAWCHQATSHYLGQCWPRSMSPYGVTRPQWVNLLLMNWMRLYQIFFIQIAVCVPQTSRRSPLVYCKVFWYCCLTQVVKNQIIHVIYSWNDIAFAWISMKNSTKHKCNVDCQFVAVRIWWWHGNHMKMLKQPALKCKLCSRSVLSRYHIWACRNALFYVKTNFPIWEASELIKSMS